MVSLLWIALVFVIIAFIAGVIAVLNGLIFCWWYDAGTEDFLMALVIISFMCAALCGAIFLIVYASSAGLTLK